MLFVNKKILNIQRSMLKSQFGLRKNLCAPLRLSAFAVNLSLPILPVLLSLRCTLLNSKKQIPKSSISASFEVSCPIMKPINHTL